MEATGVTDRIRTAISQYIAHVDSVRNPRIRRKFPQAPTYKLEMSFGKKYCRLVNMDDRGGNHGAFGFVDLTTGDILKAASWSRPAKHARGNVLDQGTWDASFTDYGVICMETWRT